MVRVERCLENIVASRKGELETVLVMDADRTLSEVDTGPLFWKSPNVESPLNKLFRGPLGYSYTAFRQSTLLHEEFSDEQEGLSNSIKVIGGRPLDGLVVNAKANAAVVARLRDVHKMHVLAFGDDPLDLSILSKANQGIVVVGKE